MNNNYTETGVASRGISLFGRTSRTLHCHARRRPYASLFRLKYYKWWEALWVPNRLVVPLMKGTGCSGKTRNTQGWLMIAPCSSGVIRDQKQRENRIETNDFFPPACRCCCLMYFFLCMASAALFQIVLRKCASTQHAWLMDCFSCIPPHCCNRHSAGRYLSCYFNLTWDFSNWNQELAFEC